MRCSCIFRDAPLGGAELPALVIGPRLVQDICHQIFTQVTLEEACREVIERLSEIVWTENVFFQQQISTYSYKVKPYNIKVRLGRVFVCLQQKLQIKSIISTAERCS